MPQFPCLYNGKDYEFIEFSKRPVVRIKGSNVGKVLSAMLGANCVEEKDGDGGLALPRGLPDIVAGREAG